MNQNTPNLNGFPTDNSPSTQLKYDIVASKFMTGIENHNKRNTRTSLSNDLDLIGAVLQLVVAIVVLFGLGLRWVCQRL
ncbi:hypothetical protein D3C87_420020 [compost metagenome]